MLSRENLERMCKAAERMHDELSDQYERLKSDNIEGTWSIYTRMITSLNDWREFLEQTMEELL